MSKCENTGKRDLTYSRWHRTLPDHCTWVDIDSVHYCNNCGSLLSMFELAQCSHSADLKDKCRQKVASVTERAANLCEIPSYKIAYTNSMDSAVQRLGQRDIEIVSEAGLRKFITQMHDNCAFCRKHNQ